MFRQNKIRPQAAQTSLLLLDKLYPELNCNHRSVAVEITGAIDIEAFKNAFDLLMARHEMLRAVVKEGDTGLYFHISRIKDKYSEDDLPLKIIDAAHLNPSTSSLKLEDLYSTLRKVKEERFIEAPFNLRKGPLWRAVLVKIAENKYHFSMMFNHAIVDETSIGVLLKDLSAYYNILLDDPNQTNLLNIPSLTNIDLELSSIEVDTRLNHWKNELHYLNIVNLQTDFMPQQTFRFAGKRRSFTLDKELISQIETNDHFREHSLNQILLAVFYSLLYRYSGETDICIGITSANRRHKDIDEQTIHQLVNCFFNSIPLRLSFSEKNSFSELLAQVKYSLRGALKNQLPLDMVFQQAINAQTKSSLTTASPFSVMLVFNEVKPMLTFLNTTASYPIELDLGRSKFPFFGINIDKYPDGSCKCFIEYNTDLFHEKTIDRIINHFNKSLRTISENPQSKISTIPLLSGDEIKLLYPSHTEIQPVTDLVPDFFHKRALAYPDQSFVIFHNEQGDAERLTYQQVDILSTKLANHLIKIGVGLNVKVGVCLSRSPNLIIAMLAVLKAGGVVVTMETNNCPSLTHKIEMTDACIVLTDHQTESLFKNYNKNLLNLSDNETVNLIKTYDSHYLSVKLDPQDPAYIMYTSGVDLKGAILTHAGFANLLNSLHYDQKLNPETKVICTALPTFDAFWYDLLVAIAAERGQFHFCYESGRYSPEVLRKIILKENINYGVFLVKVLDDLDPQLPLDHVISMGASPHENTLRLWENARLGRRVWNGLGHTETGICLSLFQYTEGSDPNLIGQPIRNMNTFILNPANLSLCPPGVSGEIYVAGPGVALGYVNDDKLTAEKFPVMIFDHKQGAFQRCDPNSIQTGAMRLYATGDYGCYQLQNNNAVNIKFIGRKDRQIKLYGVRIDLDNVETLMRKHPLIKDIVVLSNKEETALTAYIVPSTNGVTMEEFRKQISEYLPKTLLPSVAYPKNLIFLKSLPVSQNGKVDERALPPPLSLSPELIVIEDLTNLQKKIRGIWAKILGIPETHMSIHKSYIELGGNSLSLTAIETELNKVLALSEYIDVTRLPKSMTIKSLSETLEPLTNHYSQHTMVGQGVYFNPDSSAVMFFRKKKSRDVTPEYGNSPDNTNTDQLSCLLTKNDTLRMSK